MPCKHRETIDCCTIYCHFIKGKLPSRQCNTQCAQYTESEEKEDHTRGKSREKRLSQLDNIEERLKKMNMSDDLQRVQTFREQLLNGQYDYCEGNRQAQKLIQRLHRKINKKGSKSF